MITMMVSRLWLMSLQACALILIVLIARAALKRYPKIYSYLLWILVGLRLLCPVLVESPFSLQPAPGQVFGMMQDIGAEGQVSVGMPDAAADGVQLPDTVPGNGQGELSFPMPGAQSAAENKAAAAAPAAADGSEDSRTVGTDGGNVGRKRAADGLRNVLTIIYLAGAALVSGFYLVQYLLMRRRVSAAVRAKGNVWYCDKIDSPFVMGIFRTRIYLPYGLSEQERYYVLKHEHTHIRHHDPVILLLGILCICLHWWNPLVWLAVHRMNQDMEMFCDEAALKGVQVQERKAYARTLLAFAARQNGFSIGLAFGESNTERRVKNLMRKRRGSIIIDIVIVLLAVFCVIALLTVRGGESGTQPDGSGVQSDESGAQPDGGNMRPDESGAQPDGSGMQSDGSGMQSGESGTQSDGGVQSDESGTQSDAGNSTSGGQNIIQESAEERAVRYSAYREALENVLYDKIFPDGAECGVPGTEDGPGNYFAVFDIDGDGREELLIQYTTASMAGMREAVYDYDAETGTMREELSEFPLVTYYENGAVEVGWSHNQGLNAFSSDEFWPYNLYRYDSAADTYVILGMVDAWDRAVSEKNYAGESFPDEADEDGDGILYSVMGNMDTLEAYDALDTMVDGPALAELQEDYRGGGAQITVPWQALTAENIHGALADSQSGEVDFYGRWYVWAYQMAEVSAISAEDAQSFVGAEVIYEENYVRVNGAKQPAPGFTYTFADYTEEVLAQEYNVNLGEWWSGISEVVYGEINTSDNGFGSQFFVVNDEIIWIYHEGVFFLARREPKDTAVG